MTDKPNRKGDTVSLLDWTGVGIQFGMMGGYIKLNEQLGARPAVGPACPNPPPQPIRISQRGHHSVQFHRPAALPAGRNRLLRYHTSQGVHARHQGRSCQSLPATHL